LAHVTHLCRRRVILCTEQNDTQYRDKIQNEICPLLGFYAALKGISLPKFRYNLSVPPARIKKCKKKKKKIGPIGCPETSVRNCHYSLRDIPEKRRSNLHRGGSLKTLQIHNVSRMRSDVRIQWRKIRRCTSVQNFNSILRNLTICEFICRNHYYIICITIAMYRTLVNSKHLCVDSLTVAESRRNM
jgi:hypothetical protein